MTRKRSKAPAPKQAVSTGAMQRHALRLIKGTATFEERIINDHEYLIEVVNLMRSMGCVVVLTMGTWDFFHAGHSKYIRKGREAAAAQCPEAEHVIMVVAADTDVLTKARKGPKRPFVPEIERVDMLTELRSVDIVTLEFNMRELPTKLPHDVRIISQTTDDTKALEEQAKYCKHLINLPPQLDDSSTARLRRLALEGFERLEQAIIKVFAELRNDI